MVLTTVVHLYTKDDSTAIDKIKNKLVYASTTYRKDRGTLSWFVMQDREDPRSFTIVERFDTESAVRVHYENPAKKDIDEFIGPLLDRPHEVRRYEELDPGRAGEHNAETSLVDPSVGDMHRDA